ncbi:hypothetical protein HAY25_004633 [Salmonella enterica]|nr:hypothetical protein [Salmonella enterica]
MTIRYVQVTRPETVVLYGDCWPVMSAVQAVVQALHPSYRCVQVYDTINLSRQLSSGTPAGLIFCLRPREHLFLFYAVKNCLQYIPSMIVCDEIYFTDNIMIKTTGNIPVMTHGPLAEMVRQYRHGERAGLFSHLKESSNVLATFVAKPCLPEHACELPDIFDTQEMLMGYLQGLAYNELSKAGITLFQQRILRGMRGGSQSLEALSTLSGRGEKRVSHERKMLPVRLGMPSRLPALLYGTQFYEAIQRTPFTLAETFNLHTETAQCE